MQLRKILFYKTQSSWITDTLKGNPKFPLEILLKNMTLFRTFSPKGCDFPHEGIINIKVV
jgi:hypothetical protein